MSIYRSYKSGKNIKLLITENGVRKTYNALRKKLGEQKVRIKHNRIQVRTNSGNWQYR